MLPPPREEHAPLCPLHLLPEAASLFQGSKDVLKQMSLEENKSQFHEATSGTKDLSQAYMKTTGSMWPREKSQAAWKQSFVSL